MKRIRLWIRNVFGFSRAETNGFLILLPLMLLVLFSQPVYRFLIHKPSLDLDENQAKIDSLVANWDFNPGVPAKSEAILFEFNPNTSTQEEFNELGFAPYLSKRIINYRSKGGVFRKPYDLLNIYGMDSTFFFTIQPYVNIPIKSISKTEHKKSATTSMAEVKTTQSINLNSADTTQFKSLRGIGTVLANRIVKYRNSLGGFVSKDQIVDVYGLDSTVVKALLNRSYIDPQYVPNQLDINKATEREFSAHPYIKSKLAKTIITYRFQHGSFSKIDDLLKIDLIDQKIFNNIRPYLKIEP